MAYSTPDDLAGGLRDGKPDARARLEELLRDPLLRLFERLARDHQLGYPADHLQQRGLRLVEVYVRSRPVGAFRGQTWRAFLAEVLMHVARLLEQPHGRAGEAAETPTALPDFTGYQCQAFFRPYDRVGDAYFGGDWFIAQHDAEGALWLLLADITGHGYSAYLLASALPLVWRMAWERVGRQVEPADLLAHVHSLLEDVLPDGIYVEGTLVKLLPEGQLVLLAAGGTRLLLRRQGELRPELLKYRGCWLGLMPPNPKEQHRLQINPGDEMIVATDGLFDQLEGFRGQGLAAHLETVNSARLFDWLHGLVLESLAAEQQKDDITLVLLRRRFSAREMPQTTPPPRATDVSV